MKDDEIEFRKMLNKLTKLELVEYIDNYWNGLKKESENSLGKTDYMVDEGARIKMTQVNKMRNLLTMKSNSL